MSHPSPELILEVNIFERLEQVTSLTLGQLTQLRMQSRSQQVNLLFLAFDHRCIDAIHAKNIARELGVDVGRAPWNSHLMSGSLSDISRSVSGTHSQIVMASHTGDKSLGELSHDHSSMDSQVRSTSLSSESEARVLKKRNKRRFSDRPSLTAAVDQAISLAMAKPQSHDESSTTMGTSSGLLTRPKKKRSFSDLELKTEVEINLPSSLDDMIHTSPEYMTQKVSSVSWSEDELVIESFDGDGDQTDEHEITDRAELDHDLSRDKGQSVDALKEGDHPPRISVVEVASPQEDETKRLDFDVASLTSSRARWSQPKSVSTYHHLGTTIYTQLRTDLLLQRDVMWVSLSPIDSPHSDEDEEPTLNQQTAPRHRDELDLLSMSYQQVGRLPSHHGLPVIYDLSVSGYTSTNQRIHYRSLPKGILLKEVLHTPTSVEVRQSYLSLSAHQIFWQLALQVHLAHQSQVVHLAISPHALWYDQGSITLGQWEWCQSSSAQLSHPWSSEHQVERDAEVWIAPELRGGLAAIDLIRADVYSLAATAYWLYAGSPPPENINDARLLLNKHFRRQHELLVEAILSALSPDPSQRPAHAGALLAGCVQHSISVNTLVDFYRAIYNYPLI
jgi:hypothetical protein